MPNYLDDDYRCILISYNLSQIVVSYDWTVIRATVWRRKEKIVSAEKVKSANISTEQQEIQTSWKGWPGNLGKTSHTYPLIQTYPPYGMSE